MYHSNAIILFSGTTQIDRSNIQDPFASLPWDDLDALYTALLGDTLRNVSQLSDVDILVYRNEREISDDYFASNRHRVRLLNLTEAPLAGQIRSAIENAFASNYQRVMIILDYNPLVHQATYERVFEQLRYEDDCIVVGPTREGKCFLIGMKLNHGKLFDASDGDPLKKSELLMQQICATQAIVFLLNPLNSLDNGINLIQLKKTIDAMDKGGSEFPNKTFGIFKMLEKKYRSRRILT